MKKYSKEFFEQILKKVTNFDDEFFNNPFFFKYDEWISFYIKKDGFKYCVDSPLDCNGGKSDIFDIYITKTNTNFPPREYHVQYILKGHKLLFLQQLKLSDEFKKNNLDEISSRFKSPLVAKVDIDYEESIKNPKKELNLYVWWEFGKNDGDGKDISIEITNNQYAALSNYRDAEINTIDNPLTKKVLDKVYKNEIKKLKAEFKENFSPDDTFKTFNEYWDCINVGIKINDNFDEL